MGTCPISHSHKPSFIIIRLCPPPVNQHNHKPAHLSCMPVIEGLTNTPRYRLINEDSVAYIPFKTATTYNCDIDSHLV